MEYVKLKAGALFDGVRFREENPVLIADSRGVILDLVPESEAGEGVQKYPGILAPGFVNAHCHLELSHLKGLIEEKTGLVDFVCSVVATRHFEPEKIREAMTDAQHQMEASGIVAVGDICNNLLSQSVKSEGTIRYHNFVEVSGWNPAVAGMRFDKSREFYETFKNQGFSTSMVPHAPYSVSRELWGKIAPYFSQSVVSIHNQETPDEDAFFLQGTGSLANLYEKMGIDNSFFTPPGVSSLPSYFPYFSRAASIILVHNTFMGAPDLAYLEQTVEKDQRVSLCVCMRANLYIEDRVPDLDLLSRSPFNMVVGTDSLSSNYELDILAELKTIQAHFPQISLEKLLGWATLNGARALQMEGGLGSFERGKRPGVVLIENTEEGRLTSRSVSKKIL